MSNSLMRLQTIQPTQLYINRAKLERLRESFDPEDVGNNDPLPIRKFGDSLCFTDGHTRAFVYFEAGIEHIPVYYDEDELDEDVYVQCLAWCKENGIQTIGDLKGRILSGDQYYTQWIERCEQIAGKTKN